MNRVSLLILLSAATTVQAQAPTYDLAAVTEGLSSDRIRRHVEVLAHDALGGRAPGTRGAAAAAEYIEGQLRAAGVEGAFAGGSYRQTVPLHESRPLDSCRLQMWAFGESTDLDLGADYLMSSWGPASAIPRRAPLIFVGYGIVAPELDHNDYMDTDVSGAVVVFLAGEPSFFSDDETTVYASAATKRRIALSRGAVGSILIPADRAEVDSAWERLETSYSFPGLELPGAIPDHPAFILNPNRAPDLFADALYDVDAVNEMQATGTLRAFHLPVSVTFRGRFANRDFLAVNVAGRISGRDPELASSAVVVSAHYDHLGIVPGAGDGSTQIFNGAIDNALGVAGVIELAGLLSRLPLPPRRSVIFLFPTAEEAGLLGSRHFLDRPPIPTSRMAANVNVDGLAFLDTFADFILVGGRLSSLESSFERALRPLGTTLGEAPPELWIHEGFSRSDQLAFAEAGVPAVMVNEGFTWDHHDRQQAVLEAIQWLTTRYHTPKDDLAQKINYDAARQHLRAIAALVLTIANDEEAPQWHPGTPYAYERAVAVARGQ